MITYHKDIGYTVSMTIGNQNNCYVDFQVFEILHEDENSNPVYWEKESLSSVPGTTDTEKARPLIEEYMKWDACANIDFDNSVHICGPTAAKNLGLLLSRLFDLAYEMMPTADQGMFEK